MFSVVSLLAQMNPFQSRATTQFSEADGDSSFYLNQAVLHPEALSGIWEAPNGNGGAVGIHLQLATNLSDDSRVPWTPQAWQHLEVGIYERKKTGSPFGDINGFSDSRRGGSVSYKDGRLALHFIWRLQDTLAIDLDLSLQANGCWHGRFHRNSFDRIVLLCRPTSIYPHRASLLVGTWSQTSGFVRQCVHIVETAPGMFTGWTDSLQIPGKIRYPPSMPGPHQLYENYGSLLKVERSSNGIVDVEFGAYSGICCQHDFLGELSANGSVLQGTIHPIAVSFARMHGDSCMRQP